MTRRGKKPEILSPSIVATGLLALSILTPLIICTLPRPVAPQLPIPRLDRYEADRHLQSVAALTARQEISRRDEIVIERWQRVVGWGPSVDGTSDDEPSDQLVNELQLGCVEIASRAGRDHFFAVGDVAALALTRATVALQLVESGGGARFFRMAREVGLLDSRNRLRAHPLVVLALAKASWRERCGIELETEMTPTELDGLDVFLIRFGDRFARRATNRAAFRERRLRSLERFSERYPSYPSIRARAALLTADDDLGGAVLALRTGLATRPGDRALRNYLLHTSSEER